jgi:hypothetical protein
MVVLFFVVARTGMDRYRLLVAVLQVLSFVEAQTPKSKLDWNTFQ